MDKKEKTTEWVDIRESWYNPVENDWCSCSSLSTNLEDKIDKLTSIVSNLVNENINIKNELSNNRTCYNQISDELISLRKTNIELKEQIAYMHDLNERKKNMYVRSGIPFRFTPDYTFNRILNIEKIPQIIKD